MLNTKLVIAFGLLLLELAFYFYQLTSWFTYLTLRCSASTRAGVTGAWCGTYCGIERLHGASFLLEKSSPGNRVLVRARGRDLYLLRPPEINTSR